MTDPELQPISALAIALADIDPFLQLAEKVKEHNVFIDFLPPEQAKACPSEKLNHYEAFLFPAFHGAPPILATEMWERTGIPAVAVCKSDPIIVSHDCVFAVMAPTAPPDCASLIIRLAAARGRQHTEQAKRVAQLERSLEGRRVVEQAKWKLIQDEGITEPEAHSKLQRVARSMRIPLPDVAQRLLETGELETSAASE